MKPHTLHKGVTIRSLVLGLTPSMIDELLVELNKQKETTARRFQAKAKFEKLVAECGWGTPGAFLVDLGYVLTSLLHTIGASLG
jgi:hypothetical protein